MMFFGGPWMLILWVVVIALIVWGVIALGKRVNSASGATEKHTPLDIAKERYARGEIAKEEFEQVKKDLS
jgi:putative membrane protein